MAGRDIEIRASDGGRFSGYLAAPAGGGRHPGLVVIQEIFGVNAVMRKLTDGFAATGYVALCPDLFWRQQPGVQLTDKTKAEWGKASKLYMNFDVEKGVADLAAALNLLKARPECNGKAGAVGYCLGGRLAFLMAARTPVDAAVGYYGVALDQNLNEAGAIRKPLMLHVAEKDQFAPPAAQAKVREALKDNPAVTMHTYAGMDHAFARMGGEHYDKANADLANRRTAEFLKEHLG